jgi:carbon-monoxide dehydrogenase large subunit
VFVADEQARDIVHKGEIALDANGRMLAMRFEYFSNAGAYLAFTGSFINTVNLVNVASGVYDVPAVYVQAKIALTNTVPTAAYRGAGRPVASYAMERLVDEAARELGLDPAEFRRRNFVPKAKFPYKIVTGFEYDCGDFEGVLNKRCSRRWNGFRREKRSQPRRLRGRGISTYIEGPRAGLRALRPGARHLGEGRHHHAPPRATTTGRARDHARTGRLGVLGVPVENSGCARRSPTSS